MIDRRMALPSSVSALPETRNRVLSQESAGRPHTPDTPPLTPPLGDVVS
jgi:hypothetical protein